MHFIYIIYKHYIYTLYIYITYTLHIHYIYIIYTLHIHYTYIYTHYIYTLYIHFIYIHIIYTHYIYNVYTYIYIWINNWRTQRMSFDDGLDFFGRCFVVLVFADIFCVPRQLPMAQTRTRWPRCEGETPHISSGFGTSLRGIPQKSNEWVQYFNIL